MSADRRRAFVARETAISVAINLALSGAIFLALFGRGGEVAVHGLGGLAMDSLPQALAIGLMGALVPGLLARRRVRRGEIGADPRPAGLGPVPRALVSALAAAAILGSGLLLILTLAAPAALSFGSALAIKLAFGALVALAVTPGAVRAALRLPTPA